VFSSERNLLSKFRTWSDSSITLHFPGEGEAKLEYEIKDSKRLMTALGK
jgi:hypothetical protein